MAMPSHLSLEGNTQGKIEGSCEIEGREGTILVYALEHLINIPRDTHTGLPTGKRIHGALKITKEIDKSSPKLFQALTSGEQFSEVLLVDVHLQPDDAGVRDRHQPVSGLQVLSRAHLPVDDLSVDGRGQLQETAIIGAGQAFVTGLPGQEFVPSLLELAFGDRFHLSQATGAL